VLRLAIRQVQKAASFRDASDDLRELANVPLTPSYLQKLSLRIGQEWKDLHDAEVQAFRDGSAPQGVVATAKVAVVMVDGGRVQMRQDQAGRGVRGRHWRESKVACLLTMRSPVHAVDPRPEPPKKFLDHVQAARLAAEIKPRGVGAHAKPEAAGPNRSRRRKRADGPKKLVRTVLASLACSEQFGWQVAAEVERRGLGRLERKGYICDGQKYNWSIYELHLQPWGFIAILDFLHLLGYLYGAAQAAQGKGTEAAWQCYERWLRWAWAGQVRALLEELRAASTRCGQPPPDCAEEDPRRVLAEAVSYVSNNAKRMDYPHYRRLGLPISSAAVESTIKQVNRRVKGSEKFWVSGGAEAMVQLRAAYLSEDDRADRYWAMPRPRYRAVGENRLNKTL
jgi:hypothetical protein